jgi:hypothetical protein
MVLNRGNHPKYELWNIPEYLDKHLFFVLEHVEMSSIEYPRISVSSGGDVRLAWSDKYPDKEMYITVFDSPEFHCKYCVQGNDVGKSRGKLVGEEKMYIPTVLEHYESCCKADDCVRLFILDDNIHRDGEE